MSTSFEILSSSVFTQLSHGRGSSVGIATRYWLDGLEIEYRWGEGDYNTVRTGALPWGQSGGGVPLTIHSHLAPWLKKE